MKQLIKIKNSDLSFKLNLNYNNVYSRLKMLLVNNASLFADITIKSTGTTWYSEDDAEYTSLDLAPKGEANTLSNALSSEVATVRKEMMLDPELSKYVDDILEVPDNNFVFYRALPTGGYKFVLTGWGCRFIHQNTTDSNSGFIKRISRDLDFPEESKSTSGEKPSMTDILKDLGTATTSDTNEMLVPQKSGTLAASGASTQTTSTLSKSPEGSKEQPMHEIKKQMVSVKVLDQNNSGVKGEHIVARSSLGEMNLVTSDSGVANIGELPYGETFSVEFPNLQGHVERSFEVISDVETYDAYIKKLIKYSPVLFVEDQNGNAVQDYNVKVVVNGQDSIFNSGMDGVIQLQTMQEGQKFIVIDTANYANTEEYNITQAEAKTPYHFHIKRAEKIKVGITVLDKAGNPIPKATVDLAIGETPCQQITAEDGRAEFPSNVFVAGDIPVNLLIKGKGQIKSNLKYTPDNTEYTIQLQDKRPDGSDKDFNWKWLALIPLLVLLGFGGNKLYEWYKERNVPPITEMEKGVFMTISQISYSVELNVSGITINNKPLKSYYFTYSPNEGTIDNGTFDIEERVWGLATGTGFLISKEGLIATNRHIADPIAPSEMSSVLKNHFQNLKDTCQVKIDACNDQLQIWAGIGKLDQDYLKVRNALQYWQNQYKIFDKILNTADFKVEAHCKVSAAFTGTRVTDLEDLILDGQKGRDLSSYGFHKCQSLISGDPGTVKENDVAIMQLNSKSTVIPGDVYIFKVPEEDILDGNIPDAYEVTVLGYNAGMGLQDMNLQDGIKPQAQHGKITNTSEKYRIGYEAQTLGGSSGSPVLNDKHQLVAINNSGIGTTQGFNYGVRTKYLKELLDKLPGNKK